MKKIILILISASVVFSVGASVACYNTAAIGYDSANLISFYENGVYVLDFDINYPKVKRNLNRIKELVPEKIMTI